MGPKLRKIVSEKISKEEKLEQKRVLARERQRKRRARLMGRDGVDKKRTESDSPSLRSSEVFPGTPEKVSVEVEVKEECITEDGDEKTQEEEPESEIIPGPKGQMLYYDGVGYYYIKLKEDATYIWLECSHAECSLKARMRRWDKAPIYLVEDGIQHDHPPNPARRDRIMFLHTIKTRHANEDTPFSLIFQQEAYKNPVGAGFFSFDKIQAHLQKKISLSSSTNLSQESVLSAASKLSMITSGRPSLDMEPVAKKRKTDDDSALKVTGSSLKSGNLSKKLELLKSLKDVSFTECETSEPTTQLPLKPSERLPGPHPHSYFYHDGHGYFYKPLSISGNTRYLHCTFVGCHAKATMALEENAPISLETDSPAHNHSPQVHTAGAVVNEVPAAPVNKCSVRIEGPAYYYDYKGHYYFTTKLHNSKRYLRCLFPTCPAQAFMTMEENGEIQPLSGSRPHNHQPDFSTTYHAKMKQWEEHLADCLPSERLPSLRVQYCCYHDGKGFYYHQISQADNIRNLMCAEPGCPVKAHMCTQKDAPITISGLRMGHSHGSDHTLRDALLFIDSVRVRTRAGVNPARAIALEAARNPVGAERVNLQSLQICVEKAVEIASSASKDGIIEDEVDFESCLKPQKSVTLKPSTETQVPVLNHFTFPKPILEEQQSKNEEKSYTESELVPALLSNSWLYHDGSGFYYNTRSINHSSRYLQCVLPKCGAQAWLQQIGCPVKLQKPHNHGPQPPEYRAELWFFHRIKTQAQNNPDTPLTHVYFEVAKKDPEGAALLSEVEVNQLMDKFLNSGIKGNDSENSLQSRSSVHSPIFSPVEKLPNSSYGRCQYHDRQGYYYTVNRAARNSKTTYLKCISRAGCSARAILVDGMLKMFENTKHNHKPDLIHRDICLFSNALKKRARDENTPVSVIYQEEARKYPKAAAVLREDRLKGKLTSIRRYVKRELIVEDEEEEYENRINNSIESRSSCLMSEKFQPSSSQSRDVYHDGRGYYYRVTFTDDHLRYLMCCEPHCLAQAMMGLSDGDPVVKQAGAPRHCHPPDPLRRQCLLILDNIRRRAPKGNIKIETIYQQASAKEPIAGAQIPKKYIHDLVKNVRIVHLVKKASMTVPTTQEEEDLWAAWDQCERIPSEHGWVYHDCKGYFYYCHEINKSRNRRILRCCEDGCDATVWQDGPRLTRAPGSVMHNHLPEPRRRSTLLLLHRVAIRAQLDHTSIVKIYEEESRRDPEAASLIPKNKLNETLQSLTVNKYFKELEEEELCLEETTSENTFNEDEESVVTCETLHSASSGKPVYHDNNGHYFTELRKTSDTLYVKCHMPLCDVRGYLFVSDPCNLHIPRTWAEHNHNVDLDYRSKLLFIHNLRERVLYENTPVDVIYSEESKRDPHGANLVSEVSVKNLMYKLKKSKNVGDDIEEFLYEDFHDDFVEHVSDGISERVCELQILSQKGNEQIGRKAGYHEHQHSQNNEFESINIKVEPTETLEEANNESTEDEYLEEERLEEEPAMEDLSTTRTDDTVSQTDELYLPSEKLIFRSHTSVYHDGKGYYFQANTLKGNIMYMRCTEPRCKVRAMKAADRDDAPIIPTKKGQVTHNHRSDFSRRTHLLFVHHCKLRAANEINLTINEIWESEVKRDPETASRFSASNIKSQMTRYRLEQAANSEIHSMEPENTREQNSEDGITFHDASITDPLPENEPHVDVHEGAVPEKIPSLPGDFLWHAAGYFYSTCNTFGGLEKVKCVEKQCVARGQVTLGDRGQPLGIRLNKNTVHCHPPDLQRRNLLLFIDRCKKRAATTLQSIEEIYYDEAARAPEVAGQLSAVRVKRAMGVAKKEKLKKGVRLDSKESEDSGASGDHGMSELGEMTNAVTPTMEHVDEVGDGLSDGGAQEEDSDYNIIEDLGSDHDMDYIWMMDPRSLSREEKVERKKALARERQRRRRVRMLFNPDKWDQLEKEKLNSRQRATAWQKQKKAKLIEEVKTTRDQDPVWEPKITLKLGPKFVKERVKSTEEEEFQVRSIQLKLGPKFVKERVKSTEEEEFQDEETVDETYSDYVTLEEGLDSCEEEFQNEGGEDGSGDSARQSQGPNELEGEQPENTKPSQLVHGRRVNSYSYHDGNGFYYDTHRISKSCRYLKCVVVGCKAQAFMSLEQEDSPINMTRQSPAHSHPPDPGCKELVKFIKTCEIRARESDVPVVNIYDEEAGVDPVSASKVVKENLLHRMIKIRNDSLGLVTKPTELESSTCENPSEQDQSVESENDEEIEHQLDEENETERSEVLPGYRPNSTIYHDMKGYYYIFNALKENKRYLRCIEPLCRVRGSMKLCDGAPIRTSANTVHNHRPDFQRKNFVLFLQACKDRAINENLPLSQIYREECDKDPTSATMISTQNMLQRMQRARKLILRYYPTLEEQSEFAEACNSNTITTDIPPHELVEEDFQAQEAYENIMAETHIDDNYPTEEDPESEAIERAISEVTNEELTESGSKEPSLTEGGPVPEDLLQPSEILPGIRPNSTIYYDGRGYYYAFNNQTEDVWYLRCLEPQCRVRAHMDPVEGSPIIQSANTIHNHRPDYKRKQLVLWMEQAKHRAVTEDLPISTIYAQEAARDPMSASLISHENMKSRLYRARKTLMNKLSPDLDDATEEDNEVAGDKETVVVVTSPEYGQVQDNEAVFTIQTEESEDCNTVYLYHSSSSTPHQRPTYVDEHGFYYQQTTVRSSTRYLKCVESGCKARASMGLEEDSVITLSKQGCHHNHTVEQSQLAMLLDPAGSDNAPLQVIYTDEDGGEQVTLCHIKDEVERPKRPYRQRHKPELTIDPQEPPLVDASAVCEIDVAEGDLAEGDYYHNEDQQKYPLKPSEVIPGLRPDANNYHDGNGFYYELNRLSPNIRYLKCLIKDCKARAYMELGKENAPIIQTNFARHNHGPDLGRKQFTVFLHRVTRRAAEEDTPLHVIYQQEADRDPQSASQIRMENVKQRMLRFRKKHRQSRLMNQEVSSASEMDMDGSIYQYFMDGEKQELIHHDKEEGDGVEEEEKETVREEEGEGVLYESYVVSEVEVESQQQG